MSISGAKRGRFTPAFRFIAAFVCFCFFNEIILTEILRLPSSFASAQVHLSPNLVMPSADFLPAALKAIHINPESPLDIDFIVDSADQSDFKQKDFNRLIQYFLAMMTTPEKDLWVNLSPYESSRVIVSQFGETTAGRDLLLQDNLLKQLAASLTYPESKIGKDFWQRVYKQAFDLYGTTDVPIDTFTRVWITPQSAVVHEYNGTAFVAESHLKVLLEEDYLALKNLHASHKKAHLDQKVNNLSVSITREIILPEIEKEINEGKNFAPLRQVFNALILAAWFKKKLREHILSKVYVDQRKVKGIRDGSGQTAEKIYAQYLQVLKEGVYKYIREDFDDKTQSTIPRKYFSGGFSAGNSDQWLSIRKVSTMVISSREFFAKLGKKLIFAKVRLQPLTSDVNMALSSVGIKRLGLGKKIFAGLLAGALWGTSLGAVAMPVEHKEQSFSQVPVVTRQISTVQQLGFGLLSSQKIMNALKAQVTIEDVLKLHGQINQQTKKVYKIDSDYFKRNWNKVVSMTEPLWAQQVLVVAYQHKMGLQEDGQIGPDTRMSVEKSLEAVKPVFNGDASEIQEIDFLPNYPDSVGGSGPPPDSADEADSQQTTSSDSFAGPAFVVQSDSPGDSIAAYFQRVYFWLFEILLSVLIGVQVFRASRDYKKGSTDRTEFLKYFTRYLQGGKDHFFESQPYALISRHANLNDMSAKVGGNHIDLVIRSGNVLSSWGVKKQKQLTRQVIAKVIEEGDFCIMYGDNILKLIGVKRYLTRIHLIFQVPPEKGNNGKGLTVYYRGEKGILKSFQIGLAEEPFEELTDFWDQILKPKHIIQETELAELVEMLASYRQKNPLSFKDFRAQAVVAFRIRKLALATLRGIEEDKKIGQSYKDYFYFIAQYSNMTRYFLAQSGTLDTFKSSFLPVSDKLNFKIFDLPVDKIYRVVTFVEHAYSRVRGNITQILPEFYNCLRVLDDIEENFKKVRLTEDNDDQIPGEKRETKKYSRGTLEAEFDAFSMSIEIPYANSIMGLELMKRHGKILKSLRDMSVLVSPLILWLILGLSLVMWVPWAIGFVIFIFTNWLAPKFCDLWSKGEYQNFKGMLTGFTPKQRPEKFVSTSASKKMLLEYISRRFFPKAGRANSYLMLGATHFSDVQVVRENSYVEIRFVTDSQFMVKNRRKEQVLIPLRKAIFDGTLGFRAVLNGVWEDIPVKRTSVYVHPTGIRIRIDHVDTASESLQINYHDSAIDSSSMHTLDITNDAFKQLISQWDHFMENAQRGDWDNLDALIMSIQEFCSPHNIRLSDFRKNAGFYHLIRDRALATYEALVFDNTRHDPIYRQYFLELARYAIEVRFLSANFAGMDVLKSWYLPDGEFFNREVLGFPLARILRAIFGVSFLYSWVRADTLKSISRLVDRWTILDQIQIKRSYAASPNGNSRLLIEKKLKTQFEKADFAFRYPAKNSLVGSDRYNRIFGMMVVGGFLLMLVMTLGMMVLPFLLSGINFLLALLGVDSLFLTSGFVVFLNTPQLLGLSLANFSIVFYLIAYWINPIHGNNALERERNMYSKIIDSYEQRLSYRQLKVLQAQRVLGSIWSQAFYYLSYVFGIFSPTVVMGYFLYQQIQSKFWENGIRNGNRNGSHLVNVNDESQTANASGDPSDLKVSSALSGQNPGGIDLGLNNNVQTHEQNNGIDKNTVVLPDAFMQNIEGMDFQILEWTPILNPSVFLPNFVKGNAAQEFLSLK